MDLEPPASCIPECLWRTERLCWPVMFMSVSGDIKPKPGVGHLWPTGQIWTISCSLSKQSHTHSFMNYLWLLYLLSWQSWVVATETVWLTKPQIFTIRQYFTENIWKLLFSVTFCGGYYSITSLSWLLSWVQFLKLANLMGEKKGNLCLVYNSSIITGDTPFSVCWLVDSLVCLWPLPLYR